MPYATVEWLVIQIGNIGSSKESLSAVSGDLPRVTRQATESSVQGFVQEWAANLHMVYVVR